MISLDNEKTRINIEVVKRINIKLEDIFNLYID